MAADAFEGIRRDLTNGSRFDCVAIGVFSPITEPDELVPVFVFETSTNGPQVAATTVLMSPRVFVPVCDQLFRLFQIDYRKNDNGNGRRKENGRVQQPSVSYIHYNVTMNWKAIRPVCRMVRVPRRRLRFIQRKLFL